MNAQKESPVSRGRFVFVTSSGVLVLASIVLILLSMAYLRGGHPPASGIAVLLILMTVTPIATAATVAGVLEALRGDRRTSAFFILCGVCAAFAIFCLVLLFLKLVLGATI
jgi:hypothetical protein